MVTNDYTKILHLFFIIEENVLMSHMWMANEYDPLELAANTSKIRSEYRVRIFTQWGDRCEWVPCFI